MKNRKSSLIFSLSLIILAVVTWFFVWPRFNELLETKRNLDQERTKLASLKTKLSDLASLNEFELSQRNKISLQALPAGKNFFDVLAVLSKVASDKGLLVESFRVTPGELSVTEEGKLAYKLTIIGSLDAVGDFLSEIEKTMPLVSPSGKVNLELQDQNSNVEISVESYYLPLPKTLGTVDTPIQKLTAAEEKFLVVVSGFTSLPQETLPPSGGKANPFAF